MTKKMISVTKIGAICFSPYMMQLLAQQKGFNSRWISLRDLLSMTQIFWKIGFGITSSIAQAMALQRGHFSIEHISITGRNLSMICLRFLGRTVLIPCQPDEGFELCRLLSSPLGRTLIGSFAMSYPLLNLQWYSAKVVRVSLFSRSISLLQSQGDVSGEAFLFYSHLLYTLLLRELVGSLNASVRRAISSTLGFPTSHLE